MTGQVRIRAIRERTKAAIEVTKRRDEPIETLSAVLMWNERHALGMKPYWNEVAARQHQQGT